MTSPSRFFFIFFWDLRFPERTLWDWVVLKLYLFWRYFIKPWTSSNNDRVLVLTWTSSENCFLQMIEHYERKQKTLPFFKPVARLIGDLASELVELFEEQLEADDWRLFEFEVISVVEVWTLAFLGPRWTVNLTINWPSDDIIFQRTAKTLREKKSEEWEEKHSKNLFFCFYLFKFFNLFSSLWFFTSKQKMGSETEKKTQYF